MLEDVVTTARREPRMADEGRLSMTRAIRGAASKVVPPIIVIIDPMTLAMKDEARLRLVIAWGPHFAVKTPGLSFIKDLIGIGEVTGWKGLNGVILVAPRNLGEVVSRIQAVTGTGTIMIPEGHLGAEAAERVLFLARCQALQRGASWTGFPLDTVALVVTMAATITSRAVRRAASSILEEMALVAHFIIGSIIILYIMGLTGGLMVTGGKGVTGLYLIIIFNGLDKMIGGNLDTGPNAIASAEGPLGWPSAFMQIHFTATYRLRWESPSVRPARLLVARNRL